MCPWGMRTRSGNAFLGAILVISGDSGATVCLDRADLGGAFMPPAAPACVRRQSFRNLFSKRCQASARSCRAARHLTASRLTLPDSSNARERVKSLAHPTLSPDGAGGVRCRRLLEPDRCVAEAAGGAPRRSEARLSAFTSSEASEPTSLPRRLLGTAVNLSAIIRHGARSPLWAPGWTESRKIDACVGSVVKGSHLVRARRARSRYIHDS
jgi:hypothetical protein